MFSKLVTKAKAPKPIITSIRALQYGPRYNHPGFLEVSTNVMEDPRQRLELKPLEWRDGSLKYYTDYFPIKFLMVVCGLPGLLCLFSLFWYSITDSAVTLFDRRNIHPHLKIQSSNDHRAVAHPFFHLFNPYSTALPGVRDLFHDEIEQALATRKAEREQKK